MLKMHYCRTPETDTALAVVREVHLILSSAHTMTSSAEMKNIYGILIIHFALYIFRFQFSDIDLRILFFE